MGTTWVVTGPNVALLGEYWSYDRNVKTLINHNSFPISPTILKILTYSLTFINVYLCLASFDINA